MSARNKPPTSITTKPRPTVMPMIQSVEGLAKIRMQAAPIVSPTIENQKPIRSSVRRDIPGQRGGLSSLAGSGGVMR